MKILQSSLLTSLLLLFMVSCRDVHCPSFPKNLKGYLPYSKGDTLKFCNSNNDTLTTVVQNDTINDNDEFPGNCPCECQAKKTVETNDSLYINCVLSSIGEDTDNTDFEFEIGSDKFIQSVYNVNASNSKNVNLFGDTVLFENPNFINFNSIKIVKDIGIIEFYDKKNNCIWKRIEE
jgi:hypothetical protein